MKNRKKKNMMQTRAYALSETVLAIATVPDGEDSEDPYYPYGMLSIYDHTATPSLRWSQKEFRFHIQCIRTFTNTERPTLESYFVILSSEGDVFHLDPDGHFKEKISKAGIGTRDSLGYGRVNRISKIGDTLYVCGNKGQFYNRENDWELIETKILNDPLERRKLMDAAPSIDSPEYMDWLTNLLYNGPREVFLNDMSGLDKDFIYLCGEEPPGTRPILCLWDGTTLHELDCGITEAALTGIYIESPDSVWVCGREGVLLHGNAQTGFTRIDARTRNNLFHMITPYRGKLVLPASVRPGGLYELDPKTGAFGHFDPPLPRLSSRDDPDSIEGGPFFAQACGDVLWVVGTKDTFRFDGTTWERIKHPDMP
jgi:hypothetical protein